LFSFASFRDAHTYFILYDVSSSFTTTVIHVHVGLMIVAHNWAVYVIPYITLREKADILARFDVVIVIFTERYLQALVDPTGREFPENIDFRLRWRTLCLSQALSCSPNLIGICAPAAPPIVTNRNPFPKPYS